MHDISEVLAQNPIIPVLVLDDAKDAIAVAEALISGGITTAEVTFRTAVAAEAIAQMTQLDNILVGAGTIVNLDQAKAAIDAGSKYLVMPGYDQELVDFCQAQHIPVLPGATDGSWLMKAVNSGLQYVKFFPAEALGGLPVISALAGPFPQVRFVPTGGINTNNLAQYLQHPKVAACGGSWIVTKELVAENKFDEITRRASQARKIIQAD